jgi:ubiquinone/menaquinone biosynthesis C-methylase UbiE
MDEVDYNRRLFAVYSSGRAMNQSVLGSWLEAFARRLPPKRPLTIVDIGSGTGRFTPRLAEIFGGPVFGIEPSSKMRLAAEDESRSSDVTYMAGTAEEIPLSASSCDAALLSYVLHHVKDKDAACEEIGRVVKPGGTLLVRTNFTDRFPALWWYPYFPKAQRIDEAMYETFESVVERFSRHGWKYTNLDEVSVVAAASRREDFERLQKRALSLFEFLTEDEIKEGFEAIEETVDEQPDAPVLHTSDLLVLRKSS